MDYYQILNIDRYCTTKEIKKHYYRMAKQYHPDKNKNISDENFKYLSEAYTTLSNPKKRYIYDLKLKLKDNFGKDCIHHFSDPELEILDNYYQKLSKSTEFKFMKLLFHSLPRKLKWNLKNKFQKQVKSYSLLNLSDIKYIYAQHLTEDYILHLRRNLNDVYQNICKEIIVICNSKTYHLFITHSDYLIKLYNSEKSFINIHIETILLNQYTLNGHDLYYNHKINLYQYYFEDRFQIYLPNNFCINLKNTEEFNTSLKIPKYGLKDINNQRGNLYIYKNIDLTIQNKQNYREILKEIFN